MITDNIIRTVYKNNFYRNLPIIIIYRYHIFILFEFSVYFIIFLYLLVSFNLIIITGSYNNFWFKNKMISSFQYNAIKYHFYIQRNLNCINSYKLDEKYNWLLFILSDHLLSLLTFVLLKSIYSNVFLAYSFRYNILGKTTSKHVV